MPRRGSVSVKGRKPAKSAHSAVGFPLFGRVGGACGAAALPPRPSPAQMYEMYGAPYRMYGGAGAPMPPMHPMHPMHQMGGGYESMPPMPPMMYGGGMGCGMYGPPPPPAGVEAVNPSGMRPGGVGGYGICLRAKCRYAKNASADISALILKYQTIVAKNPNDTADTKEAFNELISDLKAAQAKFDESPGVKKVRM